MALEYFVILAVIAFFSVVQSIFGMGILVFGTPTLLVMGYDFTTALSHLLPASFAISLLQVLTAGSTRIPVSRYLYYFCIPGIGIGFWLADSVLVASWVNILVGCMLILSAFVRFSPPAKQLLLSALEKYFPVYHLVMGLVHGLTNLGGAMLAILATNTIDNKDETRYVVAHYYLVFSIAQMLLLATLMGHYESLISNYYSIITSSVVYLLLGNRIFLRTNTRSFDVAMTIFIAIYGIVLLLKPII
jgi:uncharacterized protein